MAGSRVRVRDRGADKFLKRTREPVPFAKVGVFGDAGAQTYEDGTTVALVAAVHEFSQRSWFRGTIDTHGAQINAMITKAAQAVHAGRITQAQAAAQLGLWLVGLIQTRIADGIPPPLSQKYLKQKQRKYPGATADATLVASGQFVGSITSEVVHAGRGGKLTKGGETGARVKVK